LKQRNTNEGKDEVTIISAGVVIEGKLISNGNVRVDGSVNGDITANGNVTVGENGEVSGEIHAEAIVIGGKVTGTVSSKDKLTLEAKAVLKGDLITKILVVEAGAQFDGQSKMNEKGTSRPAPLPTSSENEKQG
jgi:cytoskeletal protein CcmA (bactofilin family)